MPAIYFGYDGMGLGFKNFAKLLQLINRVFIRDEILLGRANVSEIGILKRVEIGNKSLTYVCRNYVCNAGVERAEEMLALIKK